MLGGGDGWLSEATQQGSQQYSKKLAQIKQYT
uniref:Uncharacterized protein n=1 Tax=Tetranychus urticae TaxID=32264 RepID=T1L3R9_TETUR